MRFHFLFHLRHNTPTLASVVLLVPQTATIAGVRVEHTEVKNHYNTLNGYRDHHKSIPPHTHSLKKCVCVCDTALLWQKFHLTCVSVYECVLCVLILFSIGMEVLLVKRSLLLLLSSLVSCVQGKADGLTDKPMALMQCTASFFQL